MKNLVLILFLLAVPAPAAFSQQSAGPSPEAVLRELEKLENEREAALKSGWGKAYSLLSAAAVSPEKALDLFEEAVRQTQFAGMSRETAQWRDWREKQGALLHSVSAKKALLYHLQYTLLTMRRAKGEEVADMLSDAIAFTAALQEELPQIVPDKALRDSIERAKSKDDATRRQRLQEELREREFAKQLLETNTSGSVIALWLGIDGELAKAQKWPKSAGDIEAMLNDVILPELREKRDPRLFAFWETKVRLAKEKAAEEVAEFAAKRFQTLDVPKLQWERAQDYLLFGDYGRAISEMLAAIRSNPLHPEADAWIDNVRKVVGEDAKGAAPDTDQKPIAPENPPET